MAKQPRVIPVINPGDEPEFVRTLELMCRYVQNLDPTRMKIGLQTFEVAQALEQDATP